MTKRKETLVWYCKDIHTMYILRYHFSSTSNLFGTSLNWVRNVQYSHNSISRWPSLSFATSRVKLDIITIDSFAEFEPLKHLPCNLRVWLGSLYKGAVTVWYISVPVTTLSTSIQCANMKYLPLCMSVGTLSNNVLPSLKGHHKNNKS